MPNQYKNKVVFNGNTLIDISDTTAVDSDVVAGKDYYRADGSKGTGTKAIYSVTKTVDSHIEVQNTSAQVLGGQSYFTVLDPVDSYWLDSVTVTMGGVDITNQVFTGMEKQYDGFLVSTDLENCYIANESITKTSFRAEIVPKASYINPQVTIEMGGIDVSNLYSSGVINIPNVTGNIVITALASRAAVESITAVYTQSGTVYDTGSLDSLKSDLVVTANYDDGTSSAVSDYTLSGTLAEGTSTITVSYGGKTATFSVTVSAAPIHPLYYGTYNLVSGSNNIGTVEQTENGSYTHVKIDFTASYNTGMFINLTSGIANNNTSNSIDNRTLWATIASGNECIFAMDNVDNTGNIQFATNFRQANSSASSSQFGSGTATHTGGVDINATMSSSFDAGCLFIYIPASEASSRLGKSIEFDVTFTVDGERWF